MKTCPHCATLNEDAHRFCQQCGKSFDAQILSLSESGQHGQETVCMSATMAARKAQRRSAPLELLFTGKNTLIVGRAPDCDVVLQHPSVSRYHAMLEKVEEGIRVSDLRSVNGVFVDGDKVERPVLLKQKQRLGIGPFLFTLDGDRLASLDSSRSLRLEARHLERVVSTVKGTKKLLDDVNLVINPGEFVTLLGPSGSGKSTLMDCLNGRRRATGGQVLANGEDFYRHFNAFRQSLGYVPQKDIVHTQLTVQRALYYTARLRLPPDTDREELKARVEDVIREMELEPHRNTLVANLSGGQIKRVSLGAELMARPCLLYVDEATSGLDAGTEARMMRLFRRLSDEGRSIICITHNVDNVDQCHLALVLVRGRVVYYGPPAEAPGYFGVRRIGEIYDRLAQREPEEWHRLFLGSAVHQEFVARRLAERAPSSPEVQVPSSLNPVEEIRVDSPSQVREGVGPLDGGEAQVPPSRKPLMAERIRGLTRALGQAAALVAPVGESLHQLRVLTRRYLELVLADRRSLRLLMLQAPLVAVFFLLGFVGKGYQREIPYTRKVTEQEKQMLRAVKEQRQQMVPGQPLSPQQRALLRQFTLNLPGVGAVSLEDALSRAEGPGLDRALDYLIQESQPVIPAGLIVNPTYTYLVLFIVVIAVLWFGVNNSAKEIVKEEAIYARERGVNLQILPYLGSKFLVLSVISAIQTALLMLLMFGTLELAGLWLGHEVPPAKYMLPYPAMFGVLFVTSVCGVALGLLLSACVNSPDRANALLPYVIIPQLILGGGVITVKSGVLFYLAALFSPVYWAFRAVRRGVPQLPPDFHWHLNYDDSVWLCLAALAAQTVVLLALTGWFLKQKDEGSN